MVPGLVADPTSAWALVTPQMRDEIAQRAWSLVSSASQEIPAPELIGSLLSLSSRDHEYIQFLSLVRSERTGEFLDASEVILDRLAQSTLPEILQTMMPVGAVDWPATMALRMSSADAGQFISRRQNPDRDLPENRLLKYLLLVVRKGCDTILTSRSESDLGQVWLRRIEKVLRRAETLASHPALQEVRPLPSHAGLMAARNSRIRGYAQVAATYELFLQVTTEPSADGLRRLLESTVLLPALEPRGYELLVLLRILNHLVKGGFAIDAVRLIGLGNNPAFTLHRHNTTVRLRFQSSPYPSQRYEQLMVHSGFEAGQLRPDILLQSEGPTGRDDILFEMKCSRNPASISDAVMQLFGYRYDMGGLPPGPRTGLVAVTFGSSPRPGSVWPQPSYVGDSRAWITDHDNLEPVLGMFGLG